MENYKFDTCHATVSFTPCQQLLHHISCAIHEKSQSRGARIGGRIVHLFLFAAIPLDTAIQIIATPIFCLIGNIYEAVRNKKNKGSCRRLFLIPFLIIGNTSISALVVSFIGVVNLCIHGPFRGMLRGHQLSKYYFHSRAESMEKHASNLCPFLRLPISRFEKIEKDFSF